MAIEINKIIGGIFDNINPNTRAVYEFSYNQFKDILNLKTEIEIFDINKTHIIKFVEHLKKKYIKGRTIKTKINALKAIFSDLEECKKGFVSPFRFLTKTEKKYIQIQDDNITKNYITPEEYEKLVTYLIKKYQKNSNLTHYQNYLIISFLYTLGLRVSELINLKQHTAYDNNIRIFIINGKGNKQRRLPVQPDLYSDLEEYNKMIENTPEDRKNGQLNFFVNKRGFELNRKTI
ncbi:MAG TPA: tyrosine-type recombinase/integrase, partial [bacterium]|nr:tyrosine-type recombinase/integrase [bacterium]